MVYNICELLGFWTLSIVRYSKNTLQNTKFRNLDLFPPSGEGRRHLLRTQQSRCIPPHLRMEADPVFETLCTLEYRTMDKIQNPSNSRILFILNVKNWCFTFIGIPSALMKVSHHATAAFIRSTERPPNSPD
jgi:hypothetical protein